MVKTALIYSVVTLYLGLRPRITSWLKFLGKNLHLVGCATLCAKSEVMLMATIMDSVVDEYYISLCGGAQLGQIKKIHQKVIQKNS